jgi:uncharacterized protein (DUF1015 family)
MATLHPFRALRPAPATAAVVSSVPYDVVTTDEARQLAAGNPLSFLRVTRSELDLPAGTDPYSAQVYAKARENFVFLKAQAPLVTEDAPSLYLYRLRMGEHEQTGVAGCFSLDEYESDIIKKHERTRRDKEDDRTRHIVELRAQTGVVFLTYPRTDAVDNLARQATAGTPLYDFTAADGTRHAVWRADAASTSALVNSFTRIPALYIADGHHRAASASRARVDLPQFDTFIAVAFPDNQTQILPYHRVVKDLAGHTPAQLLTAIGAQFPVAPGPATPRRKGEVSMYLDGMWHIIDLSNAAPGDDTRASQLDVALLQRHILEPLLTIGDIRSDKRIDFVGGARGTGALERVVRSGSAAVAFSLFPVTVEDLIAISDAGGIMPPKSTWFEPKLRDGLLIHESSRR